MQCTEALTDLHCQMFTMIYLHARAQHQGSHTELEVTNLSHESIYSDFYIECCDALTLLEGIA